MDIRIPKFANAIRNYRESGQFPESPEKHDLAPTDAQRILDQDLASIDHWRSLDEGPKDLRKGQIGDVLLTGPFKSKGYIEAQFQGTNTDGELMVYQNTPDMNYGASYATYTKYQGVNVEKIESTAFNGDLLDNTYTHVDIRLTLGGRPTDEPSKPIAQSGYFFRSKE